MILDRIYLKNFGVYEGEQTLHLTPPSPDKPIILIGGLNGGGKTTLLDALQLALYGKNAACSNRGNLSYEEFLRRSIFRGVDPQSGAGIDVSFRHTSAGTERSYRVSRTWAQNGTGIKEQVEVSCDDVFDPVLSENWLDHCEIFIPHGVADLFFFDGEKISDMADERIAARVLRTAIHSLLGLDLVDQLSADLVVLERRKRLVEKDKATQQEISTLQGEVDRLDQLLSEAELERASMQNLYDRHEKEVRALQDQFRLKGGEAAGRRDVIERERTEAEALEGRTEDALRELAAGPAPLLLIYDLLASTVHQAELEKGAQGNVLLSELLEQRDSQLLSLIRESKASQTLCRRLEDFLVSDRRERTNGNVECYLNLDMGTHHSVQALHEVVLPEIQKKAKGLTTAAAKAKQAVLNLDRQLLALPAADSLNEISTQLAARTAESRELEGKLAVQDGKISHLRAERLRHHTKLVKLVGEEVEDHISQADNHRIVQHCTAVRATLDEFRQAIVERHVKRIEELVCESLVLLLRKKSLVTGIKIDPERFSIELRGEHGANLPTDRLSAGERQLLAVSILWGLAKASTHALPTVIDTPLGRLDTSHRTNLVERYFPFASHQVILLSTNEEIDERYLKLLKGKVGRSYRLRFDESAGATHIEPGYFWQ